MNQLTLGFDTPARISRKSDPITSQKSAAETEANLGTLQSLMMSTIRHFGYPPTANEAAKECVAEFSGCVESYRKRAGELLRKGLVEQAGERKCEVTGKLAMTFRTKEQE